MFLKDVKKNKGWLLCHTALIKYTNGERMKG